MNDLKRKRINIKEETLYKLEQLFDSQVVAGRFLSMIVEEAVNQLYEKKDIEINIDIVKFLQTNKNTD